MERKDFDEIRVSVMQACGSRVIIKLDKGRNKVDEKKGVIQDASESVFTVLVDEEESSPSQLLSFQYTDIITKDIRMKLV